MDQRLVVATLGNGNGLLGRVRSFGIGRNRLVQGSIHWKRIRFLFG